MGESQAIAAFGSLAQETRLRVLRLLVQAGAEGLSAGSLAERLEVSPSNISFHLSHLERAGLIQARRQARSIIYSAAYDALRDLVRFLMEDCCAGDPRVTGRGCAPAEPPKPA
ncbi:ArsR/SmtB family transcription factor [Microvirga roseola]|uniref:ArsR/SmtB family transcription factor n=1 Tax=Microvirga roseola TaxID=2883126 RepID=UPI001E2B6EE6|nr:metalloregulator ArsR/SmtB family transcription factor [Microvirga roseola]